MVHCSPLVQLSLVGLGGLVELEALPCLTALVGLVGLHAPSGGLLPCGLEVILGGLDLGAGSGLDSTVSPAGWTPERTEVMRNIWPLLDVRWKMKRRHTDLRGRPACPAWRSTWPEDTDSRRSKTEPFNQ